LAASAASFAIVSTVVLSGGALEPRASAGHGSNIWQKGAPRSAVVN
jgi:hypothetical protein